MKFLGNYLAGEIVPYGDVFANDANTPTDCTSPSARLAKPAETVNLTAPAQIGSKDGFFGGFIDSAGFSAGSYRIYQVGTVSGHTAAQNYTFNILASRNFSTPSTLRYGGVFHDDNNTPADPSSPSYAIYDSAGMEKATGTPSKLDSKTGSYGAAVNLNGLSDGAHLLYMTGTVSAHAVAGVLIFQKVTDSVPGAPSITSATAGDTEVVLAIDAATESDVVYALYREAGGAWSAESDTFKRTGDGNITITGLTNGQMYQFAIYAKNAAGKSAWDFTWLAPKAAGDLTAEGCITLPMENLKTLVANCQAFQDWVGAGNAEGAKAFIKLVEYPELSSGDRPICFIFDAENYQSESIAVETWLEGGTLELWFEGNVDAGYEDNSRNAYLEFANVIGNILDDMKALASTDAYLVVNEYHSLSGPNRSSMKDAVDFYQARYEIKWGM